MGESQEKSPAAIRQKRYRDKKRLAKNLAIYDETATRLEKEIESKKGELNLLARLHRKFVTVSEVLRGCLYE